MTPNPTKFLQNRWLLPLKSQNFFACGGLISFLTTLRWTFDHATEPNLGGPRRERCGADPGAEGPFEFCSSPAAKEPPISSRMC